MSFFKEIAESLGAGALAGYNIINYGGEAVYIEGVKRVISIEPTLMRFECGKKKLCVLGEELTLSELGGGTVTVTGRIITVTEDDEIARR